MIIIRSSRNSPKFQSRWRCRTKQATFHIVIRPTLPRGVPESESPAIMPHPWNRCDLVGSLSCPDAS